nr:glutamine synthetase6 [Tanacetum cinerariifolium]
MNRRGLVETDKNGYKERNGGNKKQKKNADDVLEIDWNDVGAHTDYSTKSIREEGGYEIIKMAIEKLGMRHKKHIAAFGEGNERRLTGRHETADINTFKWIGMTFELTYT